MEKLLIAAVMTKSSLRSTIAAAVKTKALGTGNYSMYIVGKHIGS